MRRLLGMVVFAVLAMGGAAAADTAVQVTDPCGDARMSLGIDETTLQPTGGLSDGADLAAVDFSNGDAASASVTATLCGAAVEPVNAGPNYYLTWQVDRCAYEARLTHTTHVSAAGGVERINNAVLESSCSPGDVELDWGEDITFSGNQITVELEAADLGTYASILDPGTEWESLSARTSAPVSKNEGGGSILQRVFIETGEGRDTAGPGWGFVVDAE